MIAVWRIYGYPERLWHGIKEEDLENRREKVNADLPKIRKSLGLE